VTTFQRPVHSPRFAKMRGYSPQYNPTFFESVPDVLAKEQDGVSQQDANPVGTATSIGEGVQ